MSTTQFKTTRPLCVNAAAIDTGTIVGTVETDMDVTIFALAITKGMIVPVAAPDAPPVARVPEPPTPPRKRTAGRKPVAHDAIE